MFGPKITLFKIFNFKVKLDASWFFLALLISWSLAEGYFPAVYEGLPTVTYWWMGVIGALGIFFSIVFHELSHSLVARRYDLPIKGITLFLFGGVAEMESEPKSAKAEFFIAIAGPIASLLLAVAFYAVFLLFETWELPKPLLGIVRYLALINTVLAIFNLVPAFPLDGGRVLRAVLWGWTGNLQWATRIASNAGSVFGFVLMALGLLSIVTGNFVGGLWWFLIGMFIQAAASSQYYQQSVRHALEGESVERFMTTDPVTVSSGITVRDLVENYVYKYHHKIFPVMDGGKLVGCVTTRQIKEIPHENWATTDIRQIMTPCTKDNTIAPDADAITALERMQQTQSGRLMVVRENRLVGVIALKDLLDLFALKIDLEEHR